MWTFVMYAVAAGLCIGGGVWLGMYLEEKKGITRDKVSAHLDAAVEAVEPTAKAAVEAVKSEGNKAIDFIKTEALKRGVKL